MNCKVCGNRTNLLFEGTVLKKHSIKYFQCQKCEFIQTEEPYWLEEAYSGSISFLDVGLVKRNIELADRTTEIIRRLNLSGEFLDFGGGSGLFVRLMRDNGFEFRLYDTYKSENIYAKFFHFDLFPTEKVFDLVTSFEVFEHLIDPLKEIEMLCSSSERVLFSTELIPNKQLVSTSDWWYFLPQSGQHISLYSLVTLKWIANYFKLYLYTNGVNLHVFSKRKIPDPFKVNLGRRVINKIVRMLTSRNENSLTNSDFEFYKRKLDV